MMNIRLFTTYKKNGFPKDWSWSCVKYSTITATRIKEIEGILFDNVKILPTSIDKEIAEYAVGYVFDCDDVNCTREVFVFDNDYKSPTDNILNKSYCVECIGKICHCFIERDKIYFESCINYMKCGGIICKKCCVWKYSHLCKKCNEEYTRKEFISRCKMPIGFMILD